MGCLRGAVARHDITPAPKKVGITLRVMGFRHAERDAYVKDGAGMHGRDLTAALCGVALLALAVGCGDLPQVPPLLVWGEASPAGLQGPRSTRHNPNAPAVNPDSRGVANAVVFLRGLDPARVRPWDLPPVCVEQRGHRLHVLQGEADARVGFVRQGDAVELVSREPVFHALRGN